jgi:hypothetical protein
MDQPTRALVFALGSLGTLAPEIVRVYGARKKPPKELTSWEYYAISVVYAALGGAVAIALPAVTPWGAVYAGISTPTLVSTGLKHRKSRKQQALANSRNNIVHAIDQTLDGGGGTIKATDQTQRPPPKTKRNFGWWIELVRNHADSLFV